MAIDLVVVIPAEPVSDSAPLYFQVFVVISLRHRRSLYSLSTPLSQSTFLPESIRFAANPKGFTN